jgi:predicted GH43/DUF377 family glycosyl hydrolase
MAITLERNHNNPVIAKSGIKGELDAASAFNPTVIFDPHMTVPYLMAYRGTEEEAKKYNEYGKYVSSILFAESRDGVTFSKLPGRHISPDNSKQINRGREDPRMTKIDGTIYLHYTEVLGYGRGEKVRIGLVTSTDDGHTWAEHGVVGPPVPSKAATLFPEMINEKYLIWMTLWPDSKESVIVKAEFDSLEDLKKPHTGYWENWIQNLKDHIIFDAPENAFRGPEVGAPPIKTEDGWLFIYCGTNSSDHPEWTINAALLDLEDPSIILSEFDEPILEPEESIEVNGSLCPACVFPEGAIDDGKTINVYYGSSDEGCCLASCNREDLIDGLRAKKQNFDSTQVTYAAD